MKGLISGLIGRRRTKARSSLYQADDPAVARIIESVDQDLMNGNRTNVLSKLESANRKFSDHPVILTWLGRYHRDLAIEYIQRFEQSQSELDFHQTMRNADAGLHYLDSAVDLLTGPYQEWHSQLLANAVCGCGQLYALQANYNPELTRDQRDAHRFRSIGSLTAAFLVDPDDNEFKDEWFSMLRMINEVDPRTFLHLFELIAANRQSKTMRPEFKYVTEFTAPVIDRIGTSVEMRRRILITFLFFFAEAVQGKHQAFAREGLKAVYLASDLVGGPTRLFDHLKQSDPQAAKVFTEEFARIGKSLKVDRAKKPQDQVKGGFDALGVQEAIGLNKRSRYREAEQLLNRIIVKEPRNSQALVERGISRHHMNRFGEAYEDFVLAIDVGKHDREFNRKHISEAYAWLTSLFQIASNEYEASQHAVGALPYQSKQSKQNFRSIVLCAAYSLMYDKSNQDAAAMVNAPGFTQVSLILGYNANEMSKFLNVAGFAGINGKIQPHTVPSDLRDDFFSETIPRSPFKK